MFHSKWHSKALLAVLLSLFQSSSSFGFQQPLKQLSLRTFSVATTSSTRLSSTAGEKKVNEETADDVDDNQKKDDFIVQALEEGDPKSLGLTTEKQPAFQVEDYVFVGDHDAMKKDKALHALSSERHVWRQFRNQDAEEYLPLDIILERTWDTAEDVYMHLKRAGLEDMNKIDQDLTPEQEASRKTIVVLGSGWAAHSLMKVVDCRKIRLIIVSPTNHFVFTPMLSSAAVGTVHYQSMTEAVRASNPMIHDYIEGQATGIDVNSKKVKVQLKYKDEGGNPTSLDLNYDHLVVAVGSQVFDFNTPGVREHALKLKSIDDARKIRTALGECFERASAPDVAGNVAEQSRRVTFLIAGGGTLRYVTFGSIRLFLSLPYTISIFANSICSCWLVAGPTGVEVNYYFSNNSMLLFGCRVLHVAHPTLLSLFVLVGGRTVRLVQRSHSRSQGYLPETCQLHQSHLGRGRTDPCTAF